MISLPGIRKNQLPTFTLLMMKLLWQEECLHVIPMMKPLWEEEYLRGIGPSSTIHVERISLLGKRKSQLPTFPLLMMKLL